LGAEFARILEELPGSPIADATPLNTAASVENIELLTKGIVDIGFVMKPAISNATADQLVKLRALTRLYMDVVQIVVRKNVGIGSLTDLNARKVYVGKHGSGTKIVAEKILAELEVVPSMKVTEAGYGEASRMLVSGELDAAFFVAGTPTEAVQLALESGECTLLDLGDIRDRILEGTPDLNSSDIPVNSYENQTRRVRTVSADTFLLCREGLKTGQVFIIVRAFFDNLDRLMMAHNKAQDIRLSSAFDRLPEGIGFHDGVQRFRRKEEKRLLILTGTLGGKYYVLGKTIKSLLEPYGIDARVSHTDGSLENLQVLKARSSKQTPTLALLQYDVALAALGAPKIVYDVDPPQGVCIDTVKDMRRIATLHQETVHIMVRRDRLSPKPGSQPTLAALKDLRVCLGPERSGTRLLAHAILEHHGVDLKSRVFLSARDMVRRIHSGEIDAGFFVSYMPSLAVKTVLGNTEIKLLSVSPRRIVDMIGPALNLTEIPPQEYDCQLEGEPAVKTIATRAVLVTREIQPQVRKITQAIFEGEAFLDIEGGVETMRAELPSIRLHPAARKYYQKAGYLPSKPPINWLFQLVWYFLTSTVIIIGGAKSLVEWRRHRSRNGIGRKILDIEITPEAGKSELAALAEIRKDILDRVQLRWWRRGELNKNRWQYLDDLIERRISLVRDTRIRAMLKEIYAVKEDTGLDRELRQERYDGLETRMRDCFDRGDLDKSEYGFLVGVLENLRRAERS
jgi:TRAP transporter TAXI family solute receptor